MPPRRLSACSVSSCDDANAPTADAMCCTADCVDMKRARSCGAGTRDDNVFSATARGPCDSMKPTKITMTGSTGAPMKPNATSATRTVVPTAATRHGPNRSTSRPLSRIMKKLAPPPTKYKSPMCSRG
jgi:hypothetical protein